MESGRVMGGIYGMTITMRGNTKMGAYMAMGSCTMIMGLFRRGSLSKMCFRGD